MDLPAPQAEQGPTILRVGGHLFHNPTEPAEMRVNDLTGMLYFDALQITRRNSPRTIFRVD